MSGYTGYLLGHGLVEWNLQREWSKGVGVREDLFYLKKPSKLQKTWNGGVESRIRVTYRAVSLWVCTRRYSAADLSTGHAGMVFPGNDAVQGLVLPTTLRERVCGFKKGRSLIAPCRGQADRRIPKFLCSGTT